MARLDFDSVTKTFPGPVTALDRFSLAIDDRELIVLVGPSGAGKTTALRIAAGLERATAGSIRMDGQAIDEWRPKDRDMAMVFQQPALYPHLSVRKNAAFALRARGLPREEIGRRIAKIASDLGITDLLDRYPETLSGGEIQRASLAGALVRRPQCLLLDEPFASLDAPLRSQLRRDFRATHRRDPVTTIFVTHDQAEALALADRLVVLRAGKIEQVGTPQEVHDRPANRFVAGFLGSPPMNFLEGMLLPDEGRLLFDQPGVRLPVDVSQEAALVQHAGSPVVLGIRPQAMAVVDGDSSGNDAVLEATIVDREFQGDRWLVRCQLENGATVNVLSGDDPPEAGKTQFIRLDRRRFHCFSADESGRRL